MGLLVGGGGLEFGGVYRVEDVGFSVVYTYCNIYLIIFHLPPHHHTLH